MENVLKFQIRTTAPYNESEQMDLLEAFFAWMAKQDEDVIEDSESLHVVSAEVADVDAKELDGAIVNFLDNAEITVRLSVAGDGIGFETTLK